MNHFFAVNFYYLFQKISLFVLYIKIDNEKVVGLRKKAKRFGIKGFSRLRKQNLIDGIRTNSRNILDIEIPKIDRPKKKNQRIPR